MNVELKRIRTEAETTVLERFAAVEDMLPGKAQTHAVRRSSIALFEREGLPHRRMEQWKYTDLRMMMREIAPLAEAAGSADVPAPLVDGAVQIAIIDGQLGNLPANLPEGVWAGALADALADGSADISGEATPDTAIQALNAAFVRDGVVLKFADEADVSTPIELVFIRSANATMSHARAHVTLGNAGKATIIERHISPDGTASQSSAVTHYETGEGTELSILRVQSEGDAAIHLGEITLNLAEKSQTKVLHLVAGGKLSRIETRAVFTGENARLDLAGITMIADRQHSDLTLYVDHLVPNCDSTETFKTVVDDAAKAVFQGKIVVAQDAQKVDAQMAINTLLLSETADMVAKPELEIFADDVSCAHGATCGDIDEDLMFYLLARGIEPRQARKLLVQAFLSQGVELFEGHAFEDVAFKAIEAWLTDHANRA